MNEAFFSCNTFPLKMSPSSVRDHASFVAEVNLFWTKQNVSDSFVEHGVFVTTSAFSLHEIIARMKNYEEIFPTYRDQPHGLERAPFWNSPPLFYLPLSNFSL